MSLPQIRPATLADLPNLLEIENRAFSGDRLSKRSFKHFIKSEHSDLAVVLFANQIAGYALLLYRSGTQLARLYSLAIDPNAQGQGLSKPLMQWCEQAATARQCIFLRLEVSQNNTIAHQLYLRLGYKTLGKLKAYYADGSDGWKMEKRLHSSALSQSHRPVFYYYQQTTDFTCGPASLLMTLKTLNPNYPVTRNEELHIWREATTIFMTSGHGGCSPHGLALSAWRRGLQVKLVTSSQSTPFIDGVRSADKKEVIELVHQDFLEQLAQTDVTMVSTWPTQSELEALMAEQKPILALISTWQLNRNKAPHWVVITASDDHFVYLNDPDIEEEAHLSQTDFEQIPITKALFWKMASFGQQKLKAFIQLSNR